MAKVVFVTFFQIKKYFIYLKKNYHLSEVIQIKTYINSLSLSLSQAGAVSF